MSVTENNERVFYGVVKEKTAKLIKPTESQLMSYYIDYGFDTIDQVIGEYGIEDMLREWYNNVNFSSEFHEEQLNRNVFPIDWIDSNERVDVIDSNDWDFIYKENYEL